jgi:hypothetical protein
VLALAQALLAHPKLTLDGSEIGAGIATALAAKAAADEQQCRSDWNAVLKSADDFTSRQLES